MKTIFCFSPISSRWPPHPDSGNGGVSPISQETPPILQDEMLGDLELRRHIFSFVIYKFFSFDQIIFNKQVESTTPLGHILELVCFLGY